MIWRYGTSRMNELVRQCGWRFDSVVISYVHGAMRRAVVSWWVGSLCVFLSRVAFTEASYAFTRHAGPPPNTLRIQNFS